MFGQDTKIGPRIPDDDIRALRHDLIDEEAYELYESCNSIQALDAIADILYVTYGAAVAYGFSEEQVEKAFEEVHKSNLSKLWTVDDLKLLSTLYPNGECYFEKRGDRFIVKRADGKVIKSPSYKPADIKSCLE